MTKDRSARLEEIREIAKHWYIGADFKHVEWLITELDQALNHNKMMDEAADHDARKIKRLTKELEQAVNRERASLKREAELVAAIDEALDKMWQETYEHPGPPIGFTTLQQALNNYRAQAGKDEER